MAEDNNLGDGLKVTGNYPVDTLYGPYSSIADANVKVTPYLRSVSGVSGLSVGRTVAIDDGTIRKEYWWDGGVLDTNLVLKVVSSGGGGGGVFATNQLITLSNGKTFGKYTNGQTAPWIGLTAVQAIADAAAEYINPSFTGFNLTGQAHTVEWGTTLTGTEVYTWAINTGSGTIPTVDIFDNTAGTTLLAGTPNYGTQTQAITTILLNTNGANQSWKLIGNNTGNGTTFNSPNFVVTARPIDFYGATSATPTTSAQVRALPQNGFYAGATNLILNTGSTLIKFGVALPPDSTINAAIDLDASNASVNYALVGTINVTDAAGAARAYNYYEANIASPYSSNHRHQISIS